MLVEWLFEVETQDTLYNWSTADTEFQGTYYEGIIDPSSFSGINEAASDSNAIIHPADINFTVLFTDAIVKDEDSYNLSLEEDLLDEHNGLIESKFSFVPVTIKLLIDRSLHTTWKFKVKKVEQYYKTGTFYLENILTTYLEGDHPNTLHPREVWKVETERSDDYVIPQIFGKAFIPLRSVFSDGKRYYALGDSSFTYTIDKVASPKEWPNQSTWDSTYNFPQSISDGYKVFQAIIADSDGDNEVDANGLWKDGDFFLDMPTRVTSTELPFTSPGASPVDVITKFLKDCGVPESLIDTAGTFATSKTTFESQGIYWNGGFYNQIDRRARLSSLLTQCNATLRITDKVELYPYSTDVVKSLTRTDIVKNSFSSRPSWIKASDGGYIKFSLNEDIPQDRPSEALVWSKSTQSSASDVSNPSSNVLDLTYLRDSVVAQKLGIIYYNKEFDIEGSVSFQLVPRNDLLNVKVGDFLELNDELYGNTKKVLISSVTYNKDLSINIEASKFINDPLDFDSTNPSIIAPDVDTEEDYWEIPTEDSLTPNKSILLESSDLIVPYINESSPSIPSIRFTATVTDMPAHEGVSIEITDALGNINSYDMTNVSSGVFEVTETLGNYDTFPITAVSTAYKLDGTTEVSILESSPVVVKAVRNGPTGYTIVLSKSTQQIFCDWKGTPVANELGINGKAFTDVSVIKEGAELLAVPYPPGFDEFSIEVLTGVGCTGALKDDNTAYIESVSADSGYLPIKVYLEGTTNAATYYFYFAKNYIGRRGGVSYSIEASDSVASDWASDSITDTTSNSVAQLVIDSSENPDNNIVPGDRVTVQSSTNPDIIAQRIYQGDTKVSTDSFYSTDWSSIVVETIDGSLLVKGTVAADSLVADDTLTNNLTVGSYLTVGDSSHTSSLIRSYTYSSGTSGWSINADGTAELNNAIVRGNIYVGNASEVRSDINVANGADVTQTQLNSGASIDNAQANGNTLISGGFINASLITADNINTGVLRGIQVSASTHLNKGGYITTPVEAGDTIMYLNSVEDFPTSGYGYVIDDDVPEFFEWTDISSSSNYLYGISSAGTFGPFSKLTAVIPLAPNIVIDERTQKIRVYGYSGDSNLNNDVVPIARLGLEDTNNDGSSPSERTAARIGYSGYTRGRSLWVESSNGDAYPTVEVQNYNSHVSQAIAIRATTSGNSGDGYVGVMSTASYGFLAYGSDHNFYAAGSGSDYSPFTGSHDALMPKSIDISQGDIVCDIKNFFKVGVSNTLGSLRESQATKMKQVVGVFSKVVGIEATDKISFERQDSFSDFMYLFSYSTMPITLYRYIYNNINDENWSTLQEEFFNIYENYNYISFNALGEGCVNVVAEGGNIEIGDYICSSSTPGKGMRQDDDLLHNYTVAKAREDIVWTQEEINNNVVKIIACTYHCG